MGCLKVEKFGFLREFGAGQKITLGTRPDGKPIIGARAMETVRGLERAWLSIPRTFKQLLKYITDIGISQAMAMLGQGLAGLIARLFGYGSIYSEEVYMKRIQDMLGLTDPELQEMIDKINEGEKAIREWVGEKLEELIGDDTIEAILGLAKEVEKFVDDVLNYDRYLTPEEFKAQEMARETWNRIVDYAGDICQNTDMIPDDKIAYIAEKLAEEWETDIEDQRVWITAKALYEEYRSTGRIEK